MTRTADVDPWRNALILALEDWDMELAVVELAERMSHYRSEVFPVEKSRDLVQKAFIVVEFLSEMG